MTSHAKNVVERAQTQKNKNTCSMRAQSKFYVSPIWHTKGKAYISGHNVIGESTEALQQYQSQAQRSRYKM